MNDRPVEHISKLSRTEQMITLLETKFRFNPTYTADLKRYLATELIHCVQKKITSDSDQKKLLNYYLNEAGITSTKERGKLYDSDPVTILNEATTKYGNGFRRQRDLVRNVSTLLTQRESQAHALAAEESARYGIDKVIKEQSRMTVEKIGIPYELMILQVGIDNLTRHH